MKKQIFNEGIATRFINFLVAELPNIMFLSAILIRLGIAILLWMHAMTLFEFINNDKLRQFLVSIFVGGVEVIFTTFSLASAKLRKDGAFLKNSKSETEKVQGKRLLAWSNTFFFVTLLGSFAFNAVVLYWMQQAGTTVYFGSIEIKEALHLNIFIQAMNIIAVFTSEGAAFILNSSANVDTTTDTKKQKKPKERKLKVDKNEIEDIDFEELINQA